MEGFERDVVTSPADLRSRHGEALRALVGRKLNKTWIAWETNDDEWFADAAVLLEFEGSRLELDCFGIDSVSITWGTLDLAVKPDWYGADDISLEWRADALPELSGVKGKVLAEIHCLEYLFETKTVAGGEAAGRVDETTQAWVLVGIEFVFDGGFLSVHNGLDENAVGGEALVGPEYRRTQVG